LFSRHLYKYSWALCAVHCKQHHHDCSRLAGAASTVLSLRCAYPCIPIAHVKRQRDTISQHQADCFSGWPNDLAAKAVLRAYGAVVVAKVPLWLWITGHARRCLNSCIVVLCFGAMLHYKVSQNAAVRKQQLFIGM